MPIYQSMQDLQASIPQELQPSFDAWNCASGDYACHSDAAEIRDYGGETLWMGVSGGGYDDTADALATRTNLRCLCLDGRSIPQSIIDAVGLLHQLKRLQMDIVGKRSLSPLTSLNHLESLYLGGTRGSQDFSVRKLEFLRSIYVGGDAESVTTVLKNGHPEIRYLALGGATGSSSLHLQNLELLQAFPNLEYLELYNVSVASRSLEPCQSLERLECVIVNTIKRWKSQSVENLVSAGVAVNGRIDVLRAEMKKD